MHGSLSFYRRRQLMMIYSRTPELYSRGIVRFGPVDPSWFYPQKGPHEGERHPALISDLLPHFAPDRGLWHHQYPP